MENHYANNRNYIGGVFFSLFFFDAFDFSDFFFDLFAGSVCTLVSIQPHPRWEKQSFFFFFSPPSSWNPWWRRYLPSTPRTAVARALVPCDALSLSALSVWALSGSQDLPPSSAASGSPHLSRPRKTLRRGPLGCDGSPDWLLPSRDWSAQPAFFHLIPADVMANVHRLGPT